MSVVVDVAALHLHWFSCHSTLFRQDDASVAINHFKLWLNLHGGDDRLLYPLQLARCLINEGSHAPRLIARTSLRIIDERVAESEHGFHAINGGRHGQLLFEGGHPYNLHLTRCQQLRHVLLFEIGFYVWFAVYPHFRTVLHHLQCGIELQPSFTVTCACRYFIVECEHFLLNYLYSTFPDKCYFAPFTALGVQLRKKLSTFFLL